MVGIWTSVDTILPPPNIAVLTYSTDYKIYAVAFINSYTGKWLDDEGFALSPTHWMSLPGPPLKKQ